MKNFFLTKFLVSAKDACIPDFLDELIGSVREWLIGKFGLPSVNSIVGDWSDIYLGGGWLW